MRRHKKGLLPLFGVEPTGKPERIGATRGAILRRIFSYANAGEILDVVIGPSAAAAGPASIFPSQPARFLAYSLCWPSVPR